MPRLSWASWVIRAKNSPGGLVNMRRIITTMYIHDQMVAFLSLLCRMFGVTPDTIKAIKVWL